jgi:hypothetical protein
MSANGARTRIVWSMVHLTRGGAFARAGLKPERGAGSAVAAPQAPP